ncbi:hypothetical protein B0H19DRAFT_1147277 [Mycena capillaripes]|nr:hypothetical protein B0H19DRAFT_1147277 [Mycena capillaripes]
MHIIHTYLLSHLISSHLIFISPLPLSLFSPSLPSSHDSLHTYHTTTKNDLYDDRPSLVSLSASLCVCSTHIPLFVQSLTLKLDHDDPYIHTAYPVLSLSISVCDDDIYFTYLGSLFVVIIGILWRILSRLEWSGVEFFWAGGLNFAQLPNRVRSGCFVWLLITICWAESQPNLLSSIFKYGLVSSSEGRALIWSQGL